MADLTQKLRVLIEGDNTSGPAFAKTKKDAEDALGDKPGGLTWLGVAAGNALSRLAEEGLRAVKDGIADTVAVSIDFQAAMSGVRAIAGANEEQMAALAAKAREMGATTIFSATEAAEGLRELASAGFTTDEMMAGLENTLLLAQAGGVGLGEAAGIAAGVIRGMRLDVSDLEQVVDGLAVVANQSATGVAELGQSFAYVAPQSAAAGVSFEDTAAALGILADNQIKGSRGGTSLAAALREIIKPSVDAEKAAAALGLTFTNADGSVRNLADIVGELQTKSVSARDVLTMFGEEGGRAINALVGVGAPRLRELSQAVAHGAGEAQAMARVMTNNLSGAMKEVSSAVEEVQLKIGDELLPSMQALLQTNVAPMIRQFGESLGVLIPRIREAVREFLAMPDVQAFGSAALDAGRSVVEFARALSQFWPELKQVGSVLGGALLDAAGALLVVFEKVVDVGTAVVNATRWTIDALVSVRDAARDMANGVMASYVAMANRIIDTFNRVGSAVGITIANIDFAPLTEDAPQEMADNWATGATFTKSSLDLVSSALGATGAQAEAQHPKVVRLDQAVASTAASTATAERATRSFTERLIASGPTVEETRAKYERVRDTLGGYDTAADTAREALERFGRVKLTLAPMVPSTQEVGQHGYDMGEALSVSFLDRWRQRIADPQSGPGQFLVNELAVGIRSWGEGASTNQILRDAGSSAGYAIGTAIGGPVGGAIGQQIGPVLGSYVDNFRVGIKGALGLADGMPAWLREYLDRMEGAVQDLRVTLDEGYTAMHGAAGAAGRSEAASQALLENQLLQLQMDYAAGYITLEQVAAALGNRANAALFAAGSENVMGALGGDDFSRLMKLIPAAEGYSGLVNRPTMFLAGEAGPESVNIVPLRGSQMAGQSGFTGAAGNQFSFTINVQAWDAHDVERYAKSGLRNVVLGIVNDAGRRGASVTDDTGIRRVAAA